MPIHMKAAGAACLSMEGESTFAQQMGINTGGSAGGLLGSYNGPEISLPSKLVSQQAAPQK